MKLRIVIAGLIFGAAAFAADAGAELFQKALTAERAAGNLEEAIKLYQRVATEFASDRALAAKALVQEARCYEKLGQDEAVKIYEQIARDYRDQREPTTAANARLAALRHGDRTASNSTLRQTKIEPHIEDYFETDGHRQVYKDAATGALMISDLAGKDKRVVFKPKGGDQVYYALSSRDLSIVGMLLTRPDGSQKGAVIKTDGTGYREIDISSLAPSCFPDWSWDNRYLFVCKNQSDGTLQLMKISAVDGEIRKVQATETLFNRPSPDGRFIALAPSYKAIGKVWVIPSQGGEPQLVSESARLVDWTSDGRYLVIASARSGAQALYLVPMKDGRRAGEPVFVRYGPCLYGSTNAEGALAYHSSPPGGTYGAWLGALDSAGHLVDWKRLNLSGDSAISFGIRWSPDSTQISYSTGDEAAGQDTWMVRLRNIATGVEHELYRGGRMTCIWAAQHPNLFCSSENQVNASGQVGVGMFSISTDSGRAEPLGSLSSSTGGNLFFASRDDQSIYMQRASFQLIRWEIRTQQAMTLDVSLNAKVGDDVPLPNEHWMARRNNSAIEIRPTAGGDWKSLIGLSPTQMGFTEDGIWLLYHDVDAAGRQSLFRRATSGGPPERIGDFPIAMKQGGLRISPDGRKIIAEAPILQEVWLLQNFEPKPPAAR